MAVLGPALRREVFRTLMQDAGKGSVPDGMLKPDLSAAVDAADDWVEANLSAFNTSLPQPFRAAATLDQKIALLELVLARRQKRFLARQVAAPAP